MAGVVRDDQHGRSLDDAPTLFQHLELGLRELPDEHEAAIKDKTVQVEH